MGKRQKVEDFNKKGLVEMFREIAIVKYSHEEALGLEHKGKNRNVNLVEFSLKEIEEIIKVW